MTSTGHLVLETLVEIRLLDAVIFYQNRTRIRPVNFDIVPGFVFPRQTNLYGVRWQFWN